MKLIIIRTIAKKLPAFSNFAEKIRMNLCFYLSIDYVCNTMSEAAKRKRQ